MTRLTVLSTALVAIALIAAPARGQAPAQYLNSKSVQEELKLSEEDAKKMADELGKIPREVTGAERTEKVKKILTDGLKPEQLKRLNQIMWQRGGLAGFINNAEVQAALKPDAEQKKKIKAIRDDFQAKNRELTQGGGAQQNRDKIQELRKKTNEDLAAVLTEDQKKAWKELLGPEFKGQIGRQQNQ